MLQSPSQRLVKGGGFLAVAVVAAVAWSCAAGDLDGDTDGSGDASADALQGDALAPANDGGGAGADSATADSGQVQPDVGEDSGASVDSSTPMDDATMQAADTGVVDATAHDAHVPDASETDTGAKDTGTPDTGSPDTGSPSSPDSGCTPTATVVVNEVQTGGTGGLEDEWVELFNPGACPVTITNWTVRHTSATGTTIDKVWTAAAGTVLPAEGYGIIVGPGYTGSATALGTFGSSGVLAQAGGGVGLYDANGNRLDSMGYGTASTNPLIEGTPSAAPAAGQSVGRKPNGTDTQNNAADFQVATTPTPGAAN